MDVYNPGGHIDCTFEFNDRGRGPKIATHYIVAVDGLPLRVDETGNDYLKAPVDEHFAVKDGIAVWKSTSESGQAPAGGFYISNNGASAESALLVDALLRGEGYSHKAAPCGRGAIGTDDGRDPRRSRTEVARNRVCDHRTFL